MEKIKNIFSKIKMPSIDVVRSKISNFFFIHQESTSKKDIQWKNIVIFGSFLMALITVFAFLKPDQVQQKFLEVSQDNGKTLDRTQEKKENTNRVTAAQVWQSPSRVQVAGGNQPNLNTPMVVGPGKGENSHLQFSAGTKIKVKMADKFITSQEASPVIAVTVEDMQTDSGQVLPQGSQLYGEATYVASNERAKIDFKQIALPNGQIKNIQAIIVGPDNESGLEGKVHSDGLKNSAGEVITTFVGGLASGSVQRDFMGQSTGGITNGLLNAVATTASDRAQKYGDSLKNAREWIEVEAGTDGYAVLTQSLKMVDSEATP